MSMLFMHKTLLYNPELNANGFSMLIYLMQVLKYPCLDITLKEFSKKYNLNVLFFLFDNVINEKVSFLEIKQKFSKAEYKIIAQKRFQPYSLASSSFIMFIDAMQARISLYCNRNCYAIWLILCFRIGIKMIYILLHRPKKRKI